MDYKELMCGDLVKVEQTTEVVNAKVLGVYKDGINYEVDYSGVRATNQIHTDYVSPIELTEEILVKNGFLKRSGKEYYLKDDIVIFVGSDSCEVCTLYGECTAYSYVEDGYTTIATINYVHQLQRLLNLCNIDKEIIL